MDTTLDSVVYLHEKSLFRNPIYCIYFFSFCFCGFYLMLASKAVYFASSIVLLSPPFQAGIIFTWQENYPKAKWVISIIKACICYLLWIGFGDSSTINAHVYWIMSLLEVVVVLPAELWNYFSKCIRKTALRKFAFNGKMHT